MKTEITVPKVAWRVLRAVEPWGWTGMVLLPLFELAANGLAAAIGIACGVAIGFAVGALAATKSLAAFLDEVRAEGGRDGE